MPNRFCAICGETLDENAPTFNMCLKCYLKEHPLFTLPGEFHLIICPDCGNYAKQKDWNETNESDIILITEEAIYNYLLIPLMKKNALEFNLTLDENSVFYNSKNMIETIEFEIEGCQKKNKSMFYKQPIKIILNHELCENCSNLRSGTHFTSIMQLRVMDESQFNLLNDIIQEIQFFTEKEFNKDPKQYISKMEDKKYGVDLLLSTNELMNHLISYLKGQHNFLLKRTKKLVGRDSKQGKNIYRLTSLVKFLPVSKGDRVISENGEEYLVTDITKKRILLKNTSGAKLFLDYEEFFKLNYHLKSEENKHE